jgi:2-polyprenyl-6-hydroxyphenyl methylase / 3-demethylubiquinone-9 3-methyltransferase
MNTLNNGNVATEEFYDYFWDKYPLELQGVVQHVMRIFPDGVEDKTVLDAGFGSGLVSIAFAKLGAHVTAVDIGSKNVINAQKRAEKYGVEINFIRSDLKSLELNEQFDIVYSWGVLMMTGDAKGAFDRLVEHTKRNGRLVVALYIKTWLSGFWNFTRDIYRALPTILKRIFVGFSVTLIWLYDVFYYGVLKKNWKEMRGASRGALVEDWFGPPVRSFHSVDEVFGWYHEHSMEPKLLMKYTARFKSTSNFEIIGSWPQENKSQ